MDWCSDAFGADAGQLHLLNGYRCHKMDTVDHYHEFIDCREWQYYSPIRQQTFYRVGHRFHVYLWVGTVYEVFGELGRQPPFRYHGYGLCELFPPPFSSNNSNANNPKINFFGANGDATFFQPNYVAMPPIDPNYINLQNSELSFYAKGNSTGAVLQVGVMSDPEDAATFELVSTLVLTDQYQLYEVPLADYLGSGTYVAIRNVNMDIIRLDNLTLGPLSACSKPTRLVAHPEIYEATLEWFSTATNFNLYYKTSSAPGYTVVQNVQNTYQLTNLTENTDYMWYVAARCGDTLKESAVSTFHTLCELIPHQDLPFVETFDSCATTADLNTCFTRLSLDQDYPRV